MTGFDLSGDVFTADADAGFDEGVVRADVGASSRLGFASRFELCHGLSADVSAEAAVRAAAELGLLWLLAGDADGEALAAAGLAVHTQVTADLFDRVGVSAELSAFAEAAVAGRLSVGLDPQEIARLAGDHLSGPALAVFLAMLRETSIEAGVWGKLSFSAAAKVRTNLRGSLADDEHAGFVFEHGAEAGLGAGAGYEFYAGVRFTNPKRFFLRVTDVVTGEIVAPAREVSPPALQVQLGVLEFLLPSCLAAGYELGQLTSARLAANPEQAGRTFVDCLLAELQRFALDAVAAAAVRLVGDLLRDLAERAAAELTARERRAAAAGIDTVIAVDGRPLDLATVTDAVDGLAATLEQIGSDHRDLWRPALCALWMATATVQTIRDGVRSAGASASVGVIGLAEPASSCPTCPTSSAPSWRPGPTTRSRSRCRSRTPSTTSPPPRSFRRSTGCSRNCIRAVQCPAGGYELAWFAVRHFAPAVRPAA